MTDTNLLIARASTSINAQWVIVETESQHYMPDADIYIYERFHSSPNISINRAFACAEGDFVVFLANDVHVCDGWLEKMLKCFKVHADCGVASLGNNEDGDTQQDLIVQGVYFSVCMLRREHAWLDPIFPSVFDDTDLLFRLHLKGLKFYKNLAGRINHKKHSTYGKCAGNFKEYIRSRDLFIERYKEHADDPLYRTFAELDI